MAGRYPRSIPSHLISSLWLRFHHSPHSVSLAELFVVLPRRTLVLLLCRVPLCCFSALLFCFFHRPPPVFPLRRPHPGSASCCLCVPCFGQVQLPPLQQHVLLGKICSTRSTRPCSAHSCPFGLHVWLPGTVTRPPAAASLRGAVVPQHRGALLGLSMVACELPVLLPLNLLRRLLLALLLTEKL